ncbi:MULTISPECIES: type I-C CRISPR-associated protein Cas8c/Csd1 [Aerococcus]|uniref:type I-C CRISPR-associated protein Cas8c/Csd1 n=1 Tax=Aerococcus TaxID=1375 RepID=UPI000DCED3D7|nr:type I-C CRISPR-associated protein Cas8c/Csd1 [Aerococcus urinae]RAV71464.1 type I-C CRISPR-associated protein Cas8c/Csd1 [Aerococcus urinae]RAW05179.1 type I-C CRISPR-associated protein Cas8c/Csd1 [Aerococcus urinae]
MNVLTSLYQSYLQCEENGLVDQTENLSKGDPVLLPIFHSNRSAKKNDTIEIVLDEQGKFHSADYLEEGEALIFPITQKSLVRSSNKAPNALSDELSYVCSDFDDEKFNAYLGQLKEWVDYSKGTPIFEPLNEIFNYIEKDSIVEDIVTYLFSGSKNIRINEKNKSNKRIEFDHKNKEKSISSKTFITFRLLRIKAKDFSVSKSQFLHQNYIDFVQSKLAQMPHDICQISGKEMFCAKNHPGVIGRAKIVSVSNHIETYKGRISDENKVTRIGYETSQKIHNMLKYLMDNRETATYMKDGCVLLTWSSKHIKDNQIPLVEGQTFFSENEEDNNTFSASDASLFDMETMETIDYKPDELDANAFREAFIGKMENLNRDINLENIFILLVKKMNDGRAAFQYFREIALDQYVDQLAIWYESTYWTFGAPGYRHVQSPSFYNIARFTYGISEEKRILPAKDKVQNLVYQKLLPCLVDGRRFPLDIIQKMALNVSQRNRYRKTWLTLVNYACAIMKKYYWDYEKKEVSESVDRENQSLSYLYGRLAAVYEVMELTASPVNDSEDGKKKVKVTNVEKYWSQLMNYPMDAFQVVNERIMPYRIRLKKDGKYYRRYERFEREILNQIDDLEIDAKQGNRKVGFDFILGYQAQKREIYKKSSKNSQVEAK